MSRDLPPMLTVMVDHMLGAIQSEPEYLLEVDGGPVGVTADVIMAQLIGLDDETVDLWRIRRVEPVLLAPIPQRARMVEAADVSPELPTARYNLQSSYATIGVDLLALDHESRQWFKDRPPSPDHLHSLALVRYKQTL